MPRSPLVWREMEMASVLGNAWENLALINRNRVG